MRVFIVSILLVAIGSAYAMAKDESLEELKAHFERARPEERAELGIRIARLELRDADTLYGNGNAEQARAAVDNIALYSEKTRDSAIQSDKRLKNVEIDVRKIADKLRDIKRTVSVDDQPPLDQAIKRLEEVRTTLLKEMFADNKKKEKK